MFNIFRSKKSNKPHYIGFQTDIHSHLLPGIDDGSDDIKESIELIEGLISLGIRKSITTPHIAEVTFPNTIKEISSANELVQKAITQNKIEFDLKFSAEYRLDQTFNDLFETDKLIPFPGKYLLIENSYLQPYWKLEETIYHLNLKGFTPILAHPERYTYYHNDLPAFDRLNELGCKFQINILSMAGIYGKDVKKTANHLLNKGYINFLATDAHHMRHIYAIKDYIATKEYKNILSKTTLLNDTF